MSCDTTTDVTPELVARLARSAQRLWPTLSGPGRLSARRRARCPVPSPAPARGRPASACRPTAPTASSSPCRGSPTIASRARRSPLSRARSVVVCRRSPNDTFSYTFSESKSAAYWKTIPIRRRIRSRCRLRHPRDIGAIDQHLSARRPQEPADALEQRALARAGHAHDRQRLALLHAAGPAGAGSSAR